MAALLGKITFFRTLNLETEATLDMIRVVNVGIIQVFIVRDKASFVSMSACGHLEVGRSLETIWTMAAVDDVGNPDTN